jgi:hypothetical protein
MSFSINFNTPDVGKMRFGAGIAETEAPAISTGKCSGSITLIIVQGHNALNDVLQLAHVSGPPVLPHDPQSLFRYALKSGLAFAVSILPACV